MQLIKNQSVTTRLGLNRIRPNLKEGEVNKKGCNEKIYCLELLRFSYKKSRNKSGFFIRLVSKVI
jgi:hypothetical protein